jgi:hypothetical protein
MGDIGAEVVEQFVVHLLVRDLVHPAVGVVDDKELACAEKAVGDHQRADCVVTGTAPGVANHVSVAFLQAEDAVGVDPLINAGQDRQFQPRGPRQAAHPKRLNVQFVRVEQVFHQGHRV